MASLDERVSFLEGRVEEHSRGIGDLRELIVRLDAKVDRFRGELAGRIDGLDQKVDRFRGELAGRIDGLDHKFSRQFGWLVVFHLTTLVAILGALVTR